MTKRSLLILLGISFAFNLAVLGSLFWLRITRPPLAPPKEFHMKRPPLPEHIVRRDRNPEIRRIRELFEQSKLDLMHELRKAEVDEARVLAIINSSLEAQKPIRTSFGRTSASHPQTNDAEEADEYFGKRIEFMQNRKEHTRHNRRKTP
ncbi:MAG: hypothetical protein LRZ88_11345 [Candidatus Cloacimonetes bacterium]|nr:hypothetical protein [Candidatus Cloacimonadota bacterium]